jgi:hypothetical protein
VLASVLRRAGCPPGEAMLARLCDDSLCVHAVGLLTFGQQPSTGHIRCWVAIGNCAGGWPELNVLGDGKLQVAEVNALTGNCHGS